MMQNTRQNKKKKKPPPVTKTIRKDKRDTKSKPSNRCMFVTRDDSNTPVCKLNLEGLCRLQKDVCNFSHDTRNYPCKVFHSVGECPKQNNCAFSHGEFVNEQQLEEFIRDNDKYLLEMMKVKGTVKYQKQIDSYFREQQIKQVQQQQQNKMANYQQQFNNNNIVINNNNNYQSFNNTVPSLNQIALPRNNGYGLGMYGMNNQLKMFPNQVVFQASNKPQNQQINNQWRFPSLSSLTSNVQLNCLDQKQQNKYQGMNNEQQSENNKDDGKQQEENELQEKKKQELLKILRKDPEKMKQILSIAKDLKQKKEVRILKMEGFEGRTEQRETIERRKLAEEVKEPRIIEKQRPTIEQKQ